MLFVNAALLTGGEQEVATPAYQFQPETYGAKGDGKIIGDATIAGGALSTLTSASAGFTSADTGKFILINGAGAGGNNNPPLITTITFVNSTTVTLASPCASGAVTNASAIYGTDDTAAINSAVTAAGAYATSSGDYNAQIILGSKLYIVAGALTQVGNGSSTPTFNAQIPLPYPAVSGATQKLVISFIGTGPADDCMYWESAVPNIQGSCLVSLILPSASYATFGLASVIGGPSASAGFTGGYANTKCYVDGVTVVIPFGGNQIAYDFRNIASAGAGTLGAKAFAAVNGNYSNLNAVSGPIPSAGSIGLFPPLVNNNADATFRSIVIEGFNGGFEITEHLVILRAATIYCTANGRFSQGGGMSHAAYIGYLLAEAGFAALQNVGGTCPIQVACLDNGSVEGMTWTVEDTNNVFLGQVNVTTNSGSGAPTVDGAKFLRIVNYSLSYANGHMASPPSVPATTVAATPIYRDATVVVHAGSGVTVSSITADGTATSQTVAASSSSVPIRVPSGKTIALTYSGGTPTWDWWLD